MANKPSENQTESTDNVPIEGPKRTDKPPQGYSFDYLTGKLFPWNKSTEQPVLINMPGSPYFYLPLFSSKEKLEGMLAAGRIPFDSIKHIDDGREFLTSLTESPGWTETKVILDPYFLENGRVRFTELMLNVS